MTFSPHPLVLSWYSLSWWLGLIFVFPACQVSSLHWEMFRGIFIRGKKVMGEVFVSFIPSCVFVVGCESSTDWKNVSGKWNFVEIVGKTCQESEIWGKMVGKMCQENEILGKGWKNISGKWNFRGRWKNVSGKWNFGEMVGKKHSRQVKFWGRVEKCIRKVKFWRKVEKHVRKLKFWGKDRNEYNNLLPRESYKEM